MRAKYEINIRDVDYRKYEKFREVLAENGFALESPNKILKK